MKRHLINLAITFLFFLFAFIGLFVGHILGDMAISMYKEEATMITLSLPRKELEGEKA